MTPPDLAHFLRQLKLAMLPELEHNRERHQERDRELVLTGGFNGMTDVHGHLTPEVGEKLRKALSAASRPDAEGELRTPVQRMADALEDLLDLTLGSGQLPDEGGERPHLVVHVDLDKLGEQPGEMNLDVPLPTCEYEETGPISAEQARRIACDSTALPIFLRGGKVVDAGYFTRTVPAPLRRLIVARDKTCPGDPVHREAM
jgi:hypothetical protein